MNARMILHDLIAQIIEAAVDEGPRSPEQVRPYADAVLAQVDRFVGYAQGRQAPAAEVAADPLWVNG